MTRGLVRYALFRLGRQSRLEQLALSGCQVDGGIPTEPGLGTP
jgi:hypothetical protein